MSSSTPTRFLLDENVSSKLARLLADRKVAFIAAPVSTSDRKLAELSLAESLIVVTNDTDFSEMYKNEVFGVVWLRVPQDKPAILVRQFEALLDDEVSCADVLVILDHKNRRIEPLPERVRRKSRT